jgi:hypothetical protein
MRGETRTKHCFGLKSKVPLITDRFQRNLHISMRLRMECHVGCFSYRNSMLGDTGTKTCFGLNSKVPFITVSKTQHSNGARSRLFPRRYTQQNDATSWPSLGCRISSTMQRLQWVTPHYSVSCHDNRKIVSGGQKPIVAVLWPAWACVWQQPGTWSKLRQPITFDEK